MKEIWTATVTGGNPEDNPLTGQELKEAIRLVQNQAEGPYGRLSMEEYITYGEYEEITVWVFVHCHSLVAVTCIMFDAAILEVT